MVRSIAAVVSTCACAALLFAVGCGQYRLGAGTPEASGNPSPAVSVSTVGVPADWGIDGPRLTRQLVEGLRTRGLSDVTWRAGGDGEISVECAVDGSQPDAFRRHFRARVVAECRVLTPHGTSTVHSEGEQTTVGASGGAALPGGRQTALEYAASDALSSAAAQIARTLQSPSAEKEIRNDG